MSASAPELERRVEQLELALVEHLRSGAYREFGNKPWTGTSHRLVNSVRARFPRRPAWLERGRIG